MRLASETSHRRGVRARSCKFTVSVAVSMKSSEWCLIIYYGLPFPRIVSTHGHRGEPLVIVITAGNGARDEKK